MIRNVLDLATVITTRSTGYGRECVLVSNSMLVAGFFMFCLFPVSFSKQLLHIYDIQAQ